MDCVWLGHEEVENLFTLIHNNHTILWQKLQNMSIVLDQINSRQSDHIMNTVQVQSHTGQLLYGPEYILPTEEEHYQDPSSLPPSYEWIDSRLQEIQNDIIEPVMECVKGTFWGKLSLREDNPKSVALDDRMAMLLFNNQLQKRSNELWSMMAMFKMRDKRIIGQNDIKRDVDFARICPGEPAIIYREWWNTPEDIGGELIQSQVEEGDTYGANVRSFEVRGAEAEYWALGYANLGLYIEIKFVGYEVEELAVIHQMLTCFGSQCVKEDVGPYPHYYRWSDLNRLWGWKSIGVDGQRSENYDMWLTEQLSIVLPIWNSHYNIVS